MIRIVLMNSRSICLIATDSWGPRCAINFINREHNEMQVPQEMFLS